MWYNGSSVPAGRPPGAPNTRRRRKICRSARAHSGKRRVRHVPVRPAAGGASRHPHPGGRHSRHPVPRPAAHRQRRPDVRRLLCRRRPGVHGGGEPPLRRLPRLPEGAGGHPSGRLHPPQRGAAEGLCVSGLRPADGTGPERVAEGGGGGAALCGLSLLCGKCRCGAPDPALPVRGA